MTEQKTFRTEVFPENMIDKINYSSKIMMAGSCFSENIGIKLKQHCFITDINPTGIIYNPVSIYQSLKFLLEEKKLTPNNLIFANNKWISLLHHGNFSHKDIDICLKKINTRANLSASYLKKTDFMIFTWGTSYVFEHIKQQMTVSNCHRLPSKTFKRYRVRAKEIISLYTELIEELRSIRPSMKFIITVSPVRHWRDGAIQNQISKSELLLAASELSESTDGVFYFPSYEIMMDDLRDYRFYERDMLHPSTEAVDYIWEKFKNNCIEKKEHLWIDKIKKIKKSLNHKSLEPEGEDNINFLKKIEEEIIKISEMNPNIDISYLQNKLKEKSGKNSY